MGTRTPSWASKVRWPAIAAQLRSIVSVTTLRVVGVVIVVSVVGGVTLSACGQSGPLYLPQQPARPEPALNTKDQSDKVVKDGSSATTGAQPKDAALPVLTR